MRQRPSSWRAHRGIPLGLALTCVFLGSRSTRAGDLPTWDPGNRTTTNLRGEPLPESHPAGDGVYDRFAGDVTFSLGLGAEFGSGARATVLTRALYYHTAGLTLGYADALGAGTELGRVLHLGAEVRPLFLPRWALDAEFGVPILDLTLDSLALGAGAYFGQWEGGSFAERSGFQAALGFGVPLLGTAQGPWLEARGTFRSALPGTDLGLIFLVSLYESWLSPVVR